MTLINIAVLVAGLLGFIALALAMPRHSKQMLKTIVPLQQRRLLRQLGWLLLIVALGIGIEQWHVGIGMVTWLGWLNVAGLMLVFYLLRRDRQQLAKASNRVLKNSDDGSASLPMSVSATSRTRVPRPRLAAAIVLIPLIGFVLQLLSVPQKPLLRADVIQSEIGPWPFAIVEKNQEPPQIEAMDIPLKEFVIRFCEHCDADIHMAYLKVRKPRSLRAAGNGFRGRGYEKTAEIAIPPAAGLEDGLWLTVEGKNGQVYHQQFAIERLSPALARFIRERS